MSLAEEARSLVRRPGSTCGVGRLVTDHPIGPQLEDAMAQGIEASAIARALRDHGVIIDGQAINRHRRGDCKC